MVEAREGATKAEKEQLHREGRDKGKRGRHDIGENTTKANKKDGESKGSRVMKE